MFARGSPVFAPCVGESWKFGGGGSAPNPNVTDLLRWPNLTKDERAIVEFSEAEDEEVPVLVEWALVGKVLSPSPVHVNTVRSVMKPAWGNPAGLKFRAIRERGINLFVAEYGRASDLERVLAGSPWMVGRHAVLLQNYNEKSSAYQSLFDWMELWVRVLNLPLGWMNQTRGSRAMSLIRRVVKMDLDTDGNEWCLSTWPCGYRGQQASAARCASPNEQIGGTPLVLGAI